MYAAEPLWVQWVVDHAASFPFELAPQPGDVTLQAKFLVACARPPLRNVVSRSSDSRFRTWAVDVVRMPVVFLARAARGVPNVASGRVENLLGHPEGRLWDATFLWAAAWWAGWGVKLRKDVGLLHAVWPIAGARLVDRLTIDDVWAARRHVLSKL